MNICSRLIAPKLIRCFIDFVDPYTIHTYGGLAAGIAIS